ncbi:MAG TPA: alpha-(1-_3)-arabinofuranosyltransferase [Actinophytocola sp.]|uniref:alpha-(1->3)-arabinofuranosyltransferase n=1 Tax=Actinophytocola sp. TaxID=1872138 RepID=UPI002DB8C10A|nr:alpha-(1->3)-arabinofuranosyltransferase [Actinophytocola sp.]HEU5475401.1 alpha-(1->3)-arabinofuranosyltransferase [Actinophytocola sp.]
MVTTAAPPAPPRPRHRNTWRRRLRRLPRSVGTWLATLPRTPAAWIMLGLVAVSFLQRPGRTTFDTKLDLVVDPVGFLARALHLWNPQAYAGELQNQAYGYLFPMGPFFAAGHALGLPPWITQRIWCALLLCLAFGGALLLARALRIGTEPARLAGALGYAVAPRVLTEIGPVSAEMLPAVLLPWIMLPLVRAGRIGSPRRAAGLSALAVLCIGGINASMVVMVLPLPALWLLTRKWTRQHVKLVLWWCGAVLAATLWWILPLLLLGQYSLPFLDYIESAADTTAPMSLYEAVRGTNQWVAYVVSGEPWWPSGHLLIDNPVLMLATGLVAAIGLAGLARVGLPERRFLALAVLTGITLLTIGYAGTLDGPLAGVVRPLLDGPLAPLRNVHKFEPVLRLPLMLAFMHAVSGKLPWLVGTRSTVVATRARLAVGFLLVLVLAAPAWLGTLRPGPGWDEVPQYWRSAMTWLSTTDPASRTLLLPASGFGEYTWGRTVDEPAQPLAGAPWGVRSQIPLGSEGNTRVMDAVEDVLAAGRGAPGLADYLARAGYRFLLVRNDLDRTGGVSLSMTMLRAGLAASPGISRVAGFGPELTPGARSAVNPVDRSAPPAQAVEIFEVDRAVQPVSVVAERDAVTVSGGPESLLPLLGSGQLDPDRPTVLAGDGGAPAADEWLITDGLRYRERNVGRARDNLSQTMTADEPVRQPRPAVDLLPFQGTRHQTTAAFRGVRGVSASTAVSFADAASGTEPSRQPFAAIDGDTRTAWHSSSFTGPAGEWLQVDLDTPRQVENITLQLVFDLRVGWPVTRVRITTDAGSVDHDVTEAAEPQVLATPPGLTNKVRVTVLSVSGNRQNGNVGITELTIPGITAHRALQVPADARPDREQFASYTFTRDTQPRYACVSDERGQRCHPSLAKDGEEPDGIHRLFPSSSTANYRVTGTVLPAAGGISPVTPDGYQVSASSQLAGDPAAGPLAAVDGDPNTTWIAEVTDVRPTLRLRWPQPRTITGIRLTTPPASGAARPSEVDIRTPTEFRTVALTGDGVADLRLTTDQVEITVLRVSGATAATSLGPARERNPAGIGDLRLSGVDEMADRLAADTPFTVPCGAGPKLEIDGFTYDTTVSGTLGDVTGHRPLPFGTCSDLAEGVDLPAGEHELRTERSLSFVVQDLSLSMTGRPTGAPQHRDFSVRQWDETHREIEVGPGPAALLSVRENANDGWVATVDGQQLTRTRVDGWQQAWVLPEGAGGLVRLEFVPDTDYRNRLLAGAIAVLLLLVVVALPVRRRRFEPVRPGRCRWVPVLMVGLIAVLGGMLPVVLLIGCLLLRALWPRSAELIAFGGMAVATAVAVAGRLLGHQQGWAYGYVAQAGVLLSVAAVVAACVDWFGVRGRRTRRPAPESGPGSGSGPWPESDPDPEPEPRTEPISVVEPEPEPKPEAEPEPASEPVPAPEPEPAPEPVPEPEPAPGRA